MKIRGLIALSMITSFSLQSLTPSTASAEKQSKPKAGKAAKAEKAAAEAPAAPAATTPGSTGSVGAPSPADVRASTKALREGKRLVTKRKLPEAIAKLEEAYSLDPRAEILYNLGFTHQLSQNNDKAIDFYRRYLAADPNGKDGANARRYLAGLEAKAKAEKEQRDAEDAAARLEEEEKNRLANTERERDQARADAAAALARATKAEAELTAERDKPRASSSSSSSGGGNGRGETLRMAGVGLGVAGIAGLAAGAYFGARSSRLNDELSGRNAVFYPDKVEEGEAADRNMTISFIAGGVLLAGGITAYVFGRAQGKERPRAALAPSAQPDGAGLVVTGAW